MDSARVLTDWRQWREFEGIDGGEALQSERSIGARGGAGEERRECLPISIRSFG